MIHQKPLDPTASTYYVDEKCTVRTRTLFKANNDQEAKQMIEAWDFTDYQVGDVEYLFETIDSMTMSQNEWEPVKELYNDETWSRIDLSNQESEPTKPQPAQPRRRLSTSDIKHIEWFFFEDYECFADYRITSYTDESREVNIIHCWIMPWMWYSEIPDETYYERLQTYLETHLLTL